MGLLNYTTSISGEKTVGEIQSSRARAGAMSVLHDYDQQGNVESMSFKIQTQFGMIAYRLPSNIPAVAKVLEKQARAGKIPRRYIDDQAQASRVAWRILKDWMEAQLALIE